MNVDIAIIGGGMSGLTLAKECVTQGLTNTCRIAIIEPRQVYKRDKIWSFWNVNNDDYSEVTWGEWSKFALRSDLDVEISSDYDYISIDSEKYYKLLLDIIQLDKNIEFIKGREVEKTITNDKVTLILDSGEKILANQVFDSRPPSYVPGSFDLIQHFKGIHVRSREEVFNPEQVELMDFRVNQAWGIHFVYVLPLSTTEALVEVTWFSKILVEKEIYDLQLETYLGDYYYNCQILYQEYGAIPMSLSIPQQHSWDRIIRIGVRGGLARPSTGYTFLTVQKYSRQLVHNIINGKKKIPKIRSGWIEYLDEILLRILTKYPQVGPDIFVGLFRRNDPDRIIRFLSGNSSLMDELLMMVRIPYLRYFFKEAVLAAGRKLIPGR